jgi:hypothetical protein
MDCLIEASQTILEYWQSRHVRGDHIGWLRRWSRPWEGFKTCLWACFAITIAGQTKKGSQLEDFRGQGKRCRWA